MHSAIAVFTSSDIAVEDHERILLSDEIAQVKLSVVVLLVPLS